ncbi:unnamed protein product [Brassicogethes aeneus]|uniref:DUF243 domain-containing protein n=1 Tax=Brassicogethes aeneus TaxID=1431903 RepID=A0A9P0AT78_BRAAE|nr:unnamed protein product [Brassicogethes aeneus]
MRPILLTLSLLGHVYGRPEPPVGYKYLAPLENNALGSSLSGSSLTQRTSSQNSVQFNSGFNSQSQSGYRYIAPALNSDKIGTQNTAQFHSGSSYDQSNGGYNYNAPSLNIATQNSAVPIGNINAPVGTQVFKHISYHVAPEEPEEVHQKTNLAAVQAQKHYKIIFIKAPTYNTAQSTLVQPQVLNEEKTLVYVLVKKPEAPEDLVISTPAPTQPSKPEVYFVKYKANKQQVATEGSSVGVGSGATGVQENFDSAAKSGSQSGTSGASGSVYGLPKYGPPNFKSGNY